MVKSAEINILLAKNNFEYNFVIYDNYSSYQYDWTTIINQKNNSKSIICI